MLGYNANVKMRQNVRTSALHSDVLHIVVQWGAANKEYVSLLVSKIRKVVL